MINSIFNTQIKSYLLICVNAPESSGTPEAVGRRPTQALAPILSLQQRCFWIHNHQGSALRSLLLPSED